MVPDNFLAPCKIPAPFEKNNLIDHLPHEPKRKTNKT
ncbi:hypothetical protein CGLO_16993 [Colletotrichum gloeosporioides Cg-14]|uniref:Uncharacterized protein n=1 Tax=Colletotrichum gloeosporioides (strain Cg-14) TaxID=1237896 RepID=T0JUQ0_COLGC|nr:hypothetical protein CGLO_16993 [Colletotrichum gloeosporioides Cg-14]